MLRIFTDRADVEVELEVCDVRPEGTHRALVRNADLEDGWCFGPVLKSDACARFRRRWETCPAERLYLLSRIASPVHPRDVPEDNT